MNSAKVCAICVDGIKNNIFVPLTESEKIFNNSFNFLHSALTKDIQLEFSNQNQLPFCKSCFDSALHLTQLSDQLATLQKEITDSTVAFSLSVLYRRTQAEVLKNDPKKTKTPFPSSKQMIELNVTGLSQLFPIHPLQNLQLNNPETNCVENARVIKQEHNSIRHTDDTSILEPTDCDDETVPDNNMFINADEEEHLIDDYVESDVQNHDLKLQQSFDVSDPLSLARNENKTRFFARKKIRPIRKTDMKMEVIVTEGSDILNSIKKPTIQLKKLRLNSKQGKTITNVLRSRHLSSTSKFQSTSKVSKKSNRKASKLRNTGRRINNNCKFQCEYCFKYFKNKSLLTVHLRIHTGEKPYQCKFCQKSFNQGSHLTYHERLHTGERPFKCLYCDRRFVSTTNRTSHQRLHTGEKPYKCDYCDKTFSETSNRKRHMKVHR